MELESPDDKLALLLAQVVVNRRCDGLAVVALKKRGCYASYMIADALVEIMQDRQRKRSRHSMTLANVEAKALADTHSEKQKEVELQILETEWPTCKTDTLVDPLPNKLTEEKAQTSLETLAEIKA